MDGRRFDALARTLASGSTRRQLALVAAGLAILPRLAAAEDCPAHRKRGEACKDSCQCVGDYRCGAARPVEQRLDCGQAADADTVCCLAAADRCDDDCQCCGRLACVAGRCVAGCGGEGRPCRVFATRSTHTGNLGGLEGGDAICQARAQDASRPGTYMAWLSDGSQSPATRFRTRATTPYVRVDGVAVAKNWQDVTKGNLAAPVLLTETGAAAASFAWTHTTRSGDANDGPAHCGNWRSASQSVIGDDGQTNLTGRGWTNEGAFPCNQAWTLYCFQQT